MVRRSRISKILYSVLFSFLFIIPVLAWAGSNSPVDIIDQTDTGSNRLVMFFDTRTRDTYFQVANLSASPITIHVQVFNVASQFTECEEIDFDDMYTGHDNHLYDIENIVSNGGQPIFSVDSGTYGFIVVSLESGDPNSLIGVFRILDENGYEYRANAASPEDSLADDGSFGLINFSDANGNFLSDLVGITYVSINNRDVYASPGVSTTFGSVFDEILIYDESEFGLGCSSTTFSCAVGQLDKGIDDSLPNSKGQANRVCPTSILNSNSSGWLELPFNTFTCTDPFVGNNGDCTFTPYFVGFIGLTNGDGTGSMDSWWSDGGVQQ